MNSGGSSPNRPQLHPLGRGRGGLVRKASYAVMSVDTARLAELDAEYHEVRQVLSSGPAGSGLEECLASVPS